MQESKKKKTRTLITSSGRESKTPKHLQTTDDEVPPVKKTKQQKSIAEQKEHLRNILKSMKDRTKENVNPNRISSKSKSMKNLTMDKYENRCNGLSVGRMSSEKIGSQSRINTQQSNS